MKRRPEIILGILRWLESQPEPAAEIPDQIVQCADVPPDILRYHVRLCESAGLIEHVPNQRKWRRLTWSGHDYIESNR